jgi:hypothetical protein
MNAPSQKRPGRPPKKSDEVRGIRFDMRLDRAEKEAFRDAANLAGLDLSAWVRERLRAVARQELESAGQPVAFLTTPDGPEHLTRARLVKPRTLELTFADGLRKTLSVGRLGMPVDRIKWDTAQALPTGKAMTVAGVQGDTVPIDSSTLRYLVDEAYAAKVDAELEDLQLSRGELAELARASPPPAEWYNQPERDLTRDSWK